MTTITSDKRKTITLFEQMFAEATAPLPIELYTSPTAPHGAMPEDPAPAFPKWERTSPPPPLEYEDLEDVREAMVKRVEAYLALKQANYALLLAPPPGAGKTVNTARTAKQRDSQTLLLLPRHDLYPDLTRKIGEEGLFHWQARQDADPAKQRESTCLYPKDINDLARKGYDAIIGCRRFCGDHYINHGCRYHAQRREARKVTIIVGTHEHAITGHPLSGEVDAQIIDESLLSKLGHVLRIPARGVLPTHVSETHPMYDLLNELSARVGLSAQDDPRAKHQPNRLEGWALLNTLGGPLTVWDAVKHVGDDGEINLPDIRTPDDVQCLPQVFIPQLAAELRKMAYYALDGRVPEWENDTNFVGKPQDEHEAQRSFFRPPRPSRSGGTTQTSGWLSTYAGPWFQGARGQDMLSRVRAEYGMLIIEWTRRPILPKNGKIVILDATPSLQPYVANLPCPVEVVHPNIAPKGRIFQVLSPKFNVSDTLNNPDRPRQYVEAIFRRQQYDLSQVGLITHQKLLKVWAGYGALEEIGNIDDLRQQVAMRFGLRPEHISWFGGHRGTNALEHLRALIVVGAPKPRREVLAEMARAWFPDEMAPLDLRRTRVWRTYQKTLIDQETGESYGLRYPVLVYQDERMQVAEWAMQEAEIIQAAHRIRLNIREDADLWLVTNGPIADLPPTELIAPTDLLGNKPAGISHWRWLDIQTFVEQCWEERRAFDVQDLMREFGLSYSHARRCLRAIQNDDARWETGRLDPASNQDMVHSRRGRPRTELRPILEQPTSRTTGLTEDDEE